MTDVTISHQVLDVSIVANGINVQLVAGGIVETIIGVPGPSGADGATVSGLNFTQAIPVSVWTIDHNFGFSPTVIVFNASGQEIVGTITNPSSSRTTLTFSAPISGSARLL